MNVHSVTARMARKRIFERRSDRTADTRERIKRAALELFVAQGIAETSIRDIAKRARISLGAMYNHFTSKEELAWQLFIDGWSEFGMALRSRAAGEANLAVKLRNMIEFVFRRFDEDWLLVTYIFISRHQHLKPGGQTPGGRHTISTRGNPYTLFRIVIYDAMRRGEIPRDDLDLKTAMVVGAVIQTIDSRIFARLKGPLTDCAATSAELCARMLGVER